MNKIKRIGSIFLTFLLSINIAIFTSCKQEDLFTIIEKDGYTYYYQNEKGYYILAHDKGENNSKICAIEPFLDGKEVRYFGLAWGGGWSSTSIFVPSLINVEELYLPYNMLVPEVVSGDDLKCQTSTLPNRIFLVNNVEDEVVESNAPQGTNGFWLFASEKYAQKDPLREIYFTPIGYEYRIEELYGQYPWTEGTKEYANGEYHFYLENTNYANWFIKICKANTSYMFNYENSPNEDYFFIRDYEYGEKIETVPYEPTRKGYTFDGWYKEPECINAWDFETDTLSEALYNEKNEEVYQETKLYAKWIENPQEEKEQKEKKTWWDSVLDFFGF